MGARATAYRSHCFISGNFSGIFSGIFSDTAKNSDNFIGIFSATAKNSCIFSSIFGKKKKKKKTTHITTRIIPGTIEELAASSRQTLLCGQLSGTKASEASAGGVPGYRPSIHTAENRRKKSDQRRYPFFLSAMRAPQGGDRRLAKPQPAEGAHSN